MVKIEFTIGAPTFRINNITLVRNFHSYVSGNNVRIVNAYDTQNWLLPYTNFADISINDVVYPNVQELSEALAPILFLKQGGSDTGGTATYSGNIITKTVQVPIDWSQDPGAQIVSYVNSQSFVVASTERILFKSIRIIGDVATNNSAEIHFWEFKPGKGNYGVGGTAITAEDIEYISFITNFQNNVIDLGEIGSTPIEIFINENGPYNIVLSSLNLFKATRNAVAVNYIYVGNERIIGDTEAQTISDDFIDVNATPVQDPNRVDGKSAYEIAVDFGFVGTEEEWLISLQGPPGDPGAGFENIPEEVDQVFVTDGLGGGTWQPKTTGGTGGSNVVKYDTWALLLAGQGTQTSGVIYRAQDASGHPTVDAGYAYFEYLGTTVGDHTDYRKLSEEESMDVEGTGGSIQSVQAGENISIDSTDPDNPIISALANEDSFGYEVVEVEPNAVATTHALQPLVTPTFDGSGQTVHPSVIYVPEGISGYKYFMAHTPYPSEDSTKEIPSILASNDKVTWVLPSGAPDPLVPPPASNIYADPCLFKGLDGKFYIFWLGEAGLWSISTEDFITYTDPVVLFNLDNEVSPTVVISGNKHYLYYVDSGNRNIYRIETSSTVPTSGWTHANPLLCMINNLPTGTQNWHIEIRKYYNEYHLFGALSRVVDNKRKDELYFATSPDGLSFTFSNHPLLIPESNLTWASRLLYKATAVLLNRTKYALWYCGVSDITNLWRIGYTEVSLGNVPVPTTNDSYKLTTAKNPYALYLTENRLIKNGYLINATYGFALSDENSEIPGTSSAVLVYTDYMPFKMILTELFISVKASGTLRVIVDLRKNGVSVFSTLPSINAGEFTNTTNPLKQVITASNFEKGDKIEVYLMQSGSGLKGLKAKMI